MGNWHWRLELWDDLKLSVKTFFSCINRRTNHAVITHRKILLENLESLDHTLKRATVRNVFQKSIRNYKEHWKGSRTNHINHYDLRCVAVKLLVAQSCLTLCNPMDCSPSGSSVYGILQAGILEWFAISFSRGSSWPRDCTGSPVLQVDSLPSEPPGKPCVVVKSHVNLYVRNFCFIDYIHGRFVCKVMLFHEENTIIFPTVSTRKLKKYSQVENNK